MKRHKHVIKAAQRFISISGPGTSRDIASGMTFLNGKKVHSSHFSVSSTELAAILKAHPEFVIIERRNCGGFVWGLK